MSERNTGQSSEPSVSSSSPQPSRWDLEEIREELRQVNGNLVLVLVAVLLSFLSLNVLWYLQAKQLRLELQRTVQMTKQMRQAVEDYRTNAAPLMIQFIRDLNAYARKDPQFAKILAKYPHFAEAMSNRSPFNTKN